jgi:hypothetical protein
VWRLSKFALPSVVVLFALPLICTSSRASDSAENTWDYVRVVGVASDQLSLDVEVAPFDDCKPQPRADVSQKCQQLHLIVKDMVVKDRVKQLRQGDRIKITFTFGENNQNILKLFCTDTAPDPEAHTRIWVLILSAAVCLLFYCLLSGFKPLGLILGEDNRYSNSKFQITLWFFVLITTYLATLWFRVWYAGCEFIGGVNIPAHLLLVSGMSVLTFGGAKAITTSKVNAEKAKPDGNSDPKPPAAAPNLLKDLTHDDGDPAATDPSKQPHLDFGDFQMFIITLIAVATYLVLVFHFLGTIEASKVVNLPDVDTTILAAFGLGQGAYLTKKAVGNLGQT